MRAEEVEGLRQVFAVRLDRVGGRPLLEGQVSQEIGQVVSHGASLGRPDRSSGGYGPCGLDAGSAASPTCSRALRLKTQTSNQVRLSAGEAAWSRKASVSSCRLSSS